MSGFTKRNDTCAILHWFNTYMYINYIFREFNSKKELSQVS